MGVDRAWNEDLDEPVPGVDVPAAPGSDQREAQHGLADLAAENAELYKQVGELNAELQREKDRHDAWAKEMSVRDRMRTSREEALTTRVEDLERRIAERPDSSQPGKPPDRFENAANPGTEKTQAKKDRPRFPNEYIDEGVAVGSGALAAVGIWLGTTPATDTTTLTVSALGIAGTSIALVRKLRKDRNADRSGD